MNLSEQLQQAEKLLGDDPNNAELHNHLGILYYKKQDFANALKHLRVAIHLKPDLIHAHFNLGLLFIKKGKIEAAIKQFHNVETLAPDFSPALRYLADLYLQWQDYAVAEKYYQRLIELNAVDADSLSNLGVVYLKQNQQEQAMQFFLKAILLDDKHLDARNNLAAMYLQNERYENAMRNYQVILEIKPDDLEANYNYAVAAMATGELAIATRYFEHTLKIQPANIDARINLAAIKLKLNEKKAATELYQHVLKLDPNHEIANYMLQALEGTTQPAIAPPKYVENLFDNYAGYYEKHVSEVLHYNVPENMAEILTPYLTKNMHILDLGCGSGLAAEKIIVPGTTIIGVDLSEKMLQLARKKNIYSKLLQTDVMTGLKSLNDNFDLIIAADVFVYIGDLEPVFIEVKHHLKPAGYFCFSTELAKEKYQLFDTARYGHAINYILDLAKQNSFKIIKQQQIILRYQENQPILGMIYLVRGA